MPFPLLEAGMVEVNIPVFILNPIPILVVIVMLPDPDPDPDADAPLAGPTPSPPYRYPPNPVAVAAIVIVLLPTTKIEPSVPRLMGMPPLAVAAGAPGVRVMMALAPSPTRIEGGFPGTRMGMYIWPGAGVGVGGPRRGALGKVILWAVEAPMLLMMRTGGAAAADFESEVGVEGEREMIVPPGRVWAAEPGRMVTGKPPVDGVKTMDEASGLRVMGELPIVAMTGAGGGNEPGFEKSRIEVAGLAAFPLLTESVGAITSSWPVVITGRVVSEVEIRFSGGGLSLGHPVVTGEIELTAGMCLRREAEAAPVTVDAGLDLGVLLSTTFVAGSAGASVCNKSVPVRVVAI